MSDHWRSSAKTTQMLMNAGEKLPDDAASK
jgi:hypothetical protein